LDVVDHGTKRQSRIGSLRQLRREPSGSICLRAKPSFAHARVPLKHGRHTRVAFCRTAVFGCIKAPPSSPHPVATSIHHRSARRCPAWLFFFLQLPSPHSPRPCRVAGPSATTLAKVPPCATSLPFVRVGPESPHLTSIRARPNRARSWSASRCCSRVWIRPARSGPFASAWVPLLRSHAYTACTAHAIALPNRVVQPLLLALRLLLFSARAPHSGACRARAHLSVPSLLQRLRSSVHHQHCIVPPLALTRTAAPTRSASSRARPGPLRACSLPERLLLREPHTSAPHPRTCLALVLHAPPARPGPAPLALSRACARVSRASAPPRAEPSRRRIAGAQRRTPARACPWAEPPPCACHALPPATARASARLRSTRPGRRSPARATQRPARARQSAPLARLGAAPPAPRHLPLGPACCRELLAGLC
jgi:hypothetical protein